MKRFLRTALAFVRFLFLILLPLAVTMEEQEYCMRENRENVAIPFRLLYGDVCPLIKNILYETTYDFQIHCAMKCVEDPFCAGYNFKKKEKNTPNCQLTHTLDDNFHDCNADDKGWILYHPVAPRKIPCHKMKNCKKGGKTIIYLKDGPGSDPYRCECPTGYSGDLCQNSQNATSCSALLIKHPSTLSGNYYIIPQGLSSSSAVQVYCNMTSKNGVGVTVIGHDSESRTLVNGYEPAGSYKQTIKYDISMEQIVAIMNQSKSCEQFIKYECYDSRPLFSAPFAWWVSRQGSMMNYWGGAAINSGKCACGMNNSCAGGHKCNCDMNDQTWREDSGYLTDKNTLPVTELRFGDTGQSNEKGYHTLGKLQCWS